jgi:hypothetical protein
MSVESVPPPPPPSPRPPRPPRRKWGWFFIIAFVLQAFIFIAVAANDLAEEWRQRSTAKYWVSQHDLGRAQYALDEARRLGSEATMMFVLLAVGSVVTITGTILGFRRRK